VQGAQLTNQRRRRLYESLGAGSSEAAASGKRRRTSTSAGPAAGHGASDVWHTHKGKLPVRELPGDIIRVDGMVRRALEFTCKHKLLAVLQQ
jgi:hypothetical protein